MYSVLGGLLLFGSFFWNNYSFAILLRHLYKEHNIFLIFFIPDLCWFKEKWLKFGFGTIMEASLGQALHFEFWVMKN